MEKLSLLPAGFIERLKVIIPKVYQPGVLSSFFKEKVTSLRVNTLKSSTEALERYFRSHGLKIQPYRPIPGAFVLLGQTSLKDLTALEIYRQGGFYVQSLSSMLPPLILDPGVGEKVLDLAAAPGSKTTQMAAMMENKGRITAVEINRIRLFKLLANIKTQGVTNTEVVREDGRFFWRKHRGAFDKVLLDAPCSSEGRFNAKDSATFSHWSEKLISRMRYLQKSLIFSAVNCLRSGGVLVYSTCTFEPEENEAVVDFIFRKFSKSVAIESVKLDLPNITEGLIKFGKYNFDPQLKKSVRVLPDGKFEGFFVAKIRKLF